MFHEKLERYLCEAGFPRVEGGGILLVRTAWLHTLRCNDTTNETNELEAVRKLHTESIA